MRNYIALLVQRVDFTATAPHFTSLPFIGSNLLAAYEFVAEDQGELALRKNDAEQIAAANGCTAVFQDPQQRFFTIDKTNMVQLINSAVQTALPSGYGGAEEATPRYTGWTDSDGDVRKAPPSDKKGASSSRGSKNVAPETLLQSLQTFAGVLVSAGYKTGTGSILDQLVRFIILIKNNQPYDHQKLTLLLERISLIH